MQSELQVLAMDWCVYMQAYFQGKLKIAGDIMLSQKLQAMFPPPKKAKL